MALLLNGFTAHFSAQSFQAFAQSMAAPREVGPLRQEHGHEWFLHWRDGMLYGIPRVDNPAWSFGDEQSFDLESPIHLGVISARINDTLPTKFPKYEAFRNRPFAFLGKRDEIVETAVGGWSNVSPLVATFKIRPKFELDARLYELRENQLRVGVFLSINTKWDIFAHLDDLIAAGVNLEGLYVVRRRRTDPEKRFLVGRISRVAGGVVELDESFDGQTQIPVSDVWLEGSKMSFRRCLRELLGSQYDLFEQRREISEAKVNSGTAFAELTRRMRGVLVSAGSFQLTHDLSCIIGEQIELKNEGHYKTVVQLDPAEYCFDRSKVKRSPYAWVGLTRFGPYSRDSFAIKSPRILVVCPDRAVGKVSQFIKSFRDGINSVRDSKYESGFSGVFRLHNPEFITCQIPLSNSEQAPPSFAYRKGVEEHLAGQQAGYDAAIIIILDEHSNLPDQNSPYLSAKAVLLMAGVPVQEARLSTVTQEAFSAQYIYQNIGVALYAKMGGIPWTVDQGSTADDEIVIGIGTAQLSGNRFSSYERHVGITTVFRGDGNFILSNVSKECSYQEYPAVLEATTREVLREVKARNRWQAGDTVRIVFHAFKPFRDIEVAEIVGACAREVGSEQRVEFAFLTVAHDHSFKIIDTEQRGAENRTRGTRKGVFVPERGLVTQLGAYTRLLNTNGPKLVKRPTSPLPSPLLIHLHRDSSYRDQQYLAEQVLKFTSLSWRSTLPAHEPVTILYSEMIAGLLGRLEAVPDWSPSALNTTKLRYSMWFL